MDLQYINELVELVYEYRKARHAYAEASSDDKSDAVISATNTAVVRAANNLLAFAAAEEE